jgi:ribosome-associated protein
MALSFKEYHSSPSRSQGKNANTVRAEQIDRCLILPRTMLIVTPHLRIPLREFVFTYARSGGPGGQNVNKVNSKAVLRWTAASPSLPEDIRRRFLARYGRRLTAEGDLLITSQRYRDASRNAADCLEKLRQMLFAASVVPKTRRPTKPSRSSQRRRLETKRRKSGRKQSRRFAGEE